MLDLARDAGDGPSGPGCGPPATGWLGAHLGEATLHLMDFGLSGVTALHPKVDGWVVRAGGLCGTTKTAGMSKKAWGEGGAWLAFGAAEAWAGAGMFKAWYRDFELFSPWFGAPFGPVDVELFDSGKGGAGAYGAQIPKLGNAATQDWGTIAMTGSDLRLVKEEGVGWALGGHTVWDFEDPDGTPFARVETNKVFFRMADSLAYFPQGKYDLDIDLKGASQPQPPHLGDTAVDLLTVRLDSDLPSDGRLDFSFKSLLRLSDAQELPDPTTSVAFRLSQAGSGLVGSVPKTDPFKVTVEFPLGSPTIKAGIDPHYEHGSTRFCGTLDLAMLGGKGLGAGTGTFVLGYGGGVDGWLAHYRVPLGGGAGIPIAPPLPINLFSIEGGLGYNMAKTGSAPGKFENPFADEISCAEGFTPVSTGTIFAAGMTAGTTDRSTLTARGMFSVSKGFGTRFDVDAWLLEPDPTGKGDIEGVLAWKNGAFTGKFWGGFEFLEDPTGIFGGHVVDIDLGGSESSAAVDLLFSTSGEWHIWAGSNPSNKGGTPISGRVLFAKSQAWMMLGGQGASFELDVGGKQSFEVGGCIWKCCAEAYAEIGCGLQMAVNPMKIGGSANAKFGVKLCGVGFSLSGKAKLGCCAPYADVKLCADVKPCIKCGTFECHPTLCEVCAGFSL
jgi:hypothetical protein